MNQILFSKDNKHELQKGHNFKFKNIKKTTFFKFQLITCSIFTFSLLFYYTYTSYINNQKEKVSKKIVDNFTITSLYSSENSYQTNTTSSNNDYIDNENKFSVVGLIEINSINITYPILSTVSDELLKIAPCKFYGPLPNEIGNLCIAGHNYNNYKFFSKLKDLNIGDIINIYDLTGNKVKYSIYNKYETDYNDLSCTSQDTNGNKEITLITCNNIKNRRRVIKAKES